MIDLLWITGKAFVIALILTPIFRDIFRSYNIVDRPGQRKVHQYPIPRVGGIPIALAYGLSLISINAAGTSWSSHSPEALRLIPAAALVFLIGLVGLHLVMMDVCSHLALQISQSKSGIVLVDNLYIH